MNIRRLAVPALAILLAAATAAAEPAPAGRPRAEAPHLEFQVPPGFKVEQACPAARPFIAMTFDGAGRVFLSVEDGPILLAADKDGDGIYETVSTFVEDITYCMGLLWVGPSPETGPTGTLFAVGNGPVGEGKRGHGIFRAIDTDGDLRADAVALFAPVTSMGEHGTHGIVLGPDRHLYVVVGNHSAVQVPFAPDSPLLRGYEGSVLPPLYDPNGHAINCRYPGGYIARVDLAGRDWTYYSAGFRNAYDIAFNAAGDLFTFDSDMEWDCGLPWYRPIRVIHCVEGGDYGWRTSSYNWAPHCFDSLPAMTDIGRGSPTGVTVYEHDRFPERYRGAVVVLDWSLGRVFAVLPRRAGATYGGEAEVLIAGKPQLNVTDAEVGPDGALYFTTGGRSGLGTLYRMTYAGSDVPPPAAGPADPVEQAIHLPQPSSAWSRERARVLREAGGARWNGDLVAVSRDARRAAADRVRALNLLRLSGLPAEPRFLLDLARDAEPAVRAEAAAALRDEPVPGRERVLAGLLDDADPHVRRRACEAIGDLRPNPPPRRRLYDLLGDPDRWVRYAARTALERTGVEPLRERILKESDPRRSVEGGLLLARTAMPPGPPAVTGGGAPAAKWEPPPPAAKDAAVYGKAAALLDASPPPDALRDLYRLLEVALCVQGEPPAATGDRLAGAVLKAFPHADATVAREQAILLAHWAPPGALDRLLEAAARPDLPKEEQIHLLYCARAIERGVTLDHQKRLLQWFEAASGWAGGNSFRGYLNAMLETVVHRVSPAEAVELVKSEALGPVTFAATLQRMDGNQLGEMIESLKAQYARIEDPKNPEQARRMRDAVIEGLTRIWHPPLEGWFRQIVENDPRHREQALVGLAVYKKEADWRHFVDGLRLGKRGVPEACLRAMAEIAGGIGHVPDEGATYRAVLDAARRHGYHRGWPMILQLKAWTKQDLGKPGYDQWGRTVDDWTAWMAKAYPAPAAAEQAQPPAWDFDAVGAFLARSAGRSGSPARGAAVFKKARCADCHRLGDAGGGVGPDLTGVSRRFNEAQILESIFLPSKVISDQYRSTIANTQDGRVFEGRVVEDAPDHIALLQSDGSKVTLSRDELFTTAPSAVSLMPEGLLAPLTLEDAKDLLAALAADGKADPADAAAPAWEPLFGRDLSDWTGDLALWTLQSGILVGRAEGLKKSSYLSSKAVYGDFDLAFDIRLAGDDHANSGVQYRSALDPAKTDPVGYQADIGQTYWGSIYVTDERFGLLAGAKPEVWQAAVRPNEWNHYVVRAVGDRHILEINGITTVESRDGKHPEGVFSFQLHVGSKMEVRFANARIRKLR